MQGVGNKREEYLPRYSVSSNLFFRLISERYERYCTIITTNTPFSHWQEIFGSPMLIQAILERLLNHSCVFSIKELSYRLKKKLEFFRMFLILDSIFVHFVVGFYGRIMEERLEGTINFHGIF